jgi:hypothetical protein
LLPQEVEDDHTKCNNDNFIIINDKDDGNKKDGSSKQVESRILDAGACDQINVPRKLLAFYLVHFVVFQRPRKIRINNAQNVNGENFAAKNVIKYKTHYPVHKLIFNMQYAARPGKRRRILLINASVNFLNDAILYLQI